MCDYIFTKMYFVLTLSKESLSQGSERGVPGDASLSPSRGGQSPTSHHGDFVTGTYTHDQCLGQSHRRARVVQPVQPETTQRGERALYSEPMNLWELDTCVHVSSQTRVCTRNAALVLSRCAE